MFLKKAIISRQDIVFFSEGGSIYEIRLLVHPYFFVNKVGKESV